MGPVHCAHAYADVEHAHEAPLLSPDVLLFVFRHLTIPELFDALAVCKHWRRTIDCSSVLWANLDLDFAGNRAFSPAMLQPLLLRSGTAPLDIRLKTDLHDSSSLETLCTLLEPHLERLRSLTVRARSRNQYLTLFSLFKRPLPALTHLDISYNVDCLPIFEELGSPPDGMFVLAPQLRSAVWDVHRFPGPPNRLFDVTILRLASSLSGYEEIFSLFPRLTALRLDHVSATERIEVLPPDHPLRTLELHMAPVGDLEFGDPWAHLKSLGLCRVAELELHGFPAMTLASAVRDSDWHLTALTIDSFAFADVTLASLAGSECRMLGLTDDCDLLFGESIRSEIQPLLDDRAWARTMTSLTTSLAHLETGRNMWLPLQWGSAPALVELSLVCGTPHAGEWVSLLDPHVASGYGVIEAPRLRLLRLLARMDSLDDRVSQPSALARLIVDHVCAGGGPIPLLRISLFLSFAEDEAGMDQLRSVIDKIEDTVHDRIAE